MKTRLFILLLGLSALFLSWTAQAADLLTVYQQALANDPTFQSERAQWLADKENFPINLSALLPSVEVEGSYNPTYTKKTAKATDKLEYQNNVSEVTATITQKVFNFSAWAAVASANATVKQATATFNAAAQDLIIRVATAYFNVLQASDDLIYTEAEKQAIARQLQQTQERYKVGLIAITDVYETKASYQSILAQEIAAKNTLTNRIEELREITNKVYPSIAGVNDTLPLVSPKPTDINRWVKVAKRQNYTLLAAHYATLAAKRNITTEGTKGLPTVDVSADYDYLHQTNPTGTTGWQEQQQVGGEVSVDFPVIQGGLVLASTRQASYLYQQAEANEEQTYRSIVADTRNAYLGVLAGISQTKANKESIVSNQSALKATEAGYIVGTRTIVDVLDAQSALYAAQKDYSQSQYQYLLDLLTLKQAAGTLSVKDLEKINSWLKKSISLKVYKEVTRRSSFAPDKTDVDKAALKTKPTNKNSTSKNSKQKTTKKKKTPKKKASTQKSKTDDLPSPALPTPQSNSSS